MNDRQRKKKKFIESWKGFPKKILFIKKVQINKKKKTFTIKKNEGKAYYQLKVEAIKKGNSWNECEKLVEFHSFVSSSCIFFLLFFSHKTSLNDTSTARENISFFQQQQNNENVENKISWQ